MTYSARYLDREERYEIAWLREAGLSVRQVAARLGRSTVLPRQMHGLVSGRGEPA